MGHDRLFCIGVSLLAYLIWIIDSEAVGFYAVTLPAKDFMLPIDRHVPGLQFLIADIS